MNQKRLIYTNIWASEQVGKLSVEARLLFIGLITLGDDDGILRGNPAYLRSMIFPYDDDIDVASVEKFLKEIVDQKLIIAYEVENIKYIYHPNWLRFQKLRNDRYTPTTYPVPQSFQGGSELVTNPSPKSARMGTNPLHNITKHNITKHNLTKHNLTKLNITELNLMFEKWWKNYPKKVLKMKAQQLFYKVNPDQTLFKKMLSALDNHRESEQWNTQDGKYIPHPTTYLNGARWEDELKPAKSSKVGDKYENIK